MVIRIWEMGFSEHQYWQKRHTFFILFFKIKTMSQAFVKESEEQWLHEVLPTLNPLIIYLTRESNGVRVYEQKKIY